MADFNQPGRGADPARQNGRGRTDHGGTGRGLSGGGAPPHARPYDLVTLGLAAGEKVRWRTGSSGRWQTGTVVRRERDGSVGVTDHRGMARSFAVDRLEVACRGRRGAKGWEPLSERAARSEQLRLI